MIGFKSELSRSSLRLVDGLVINTKEDLKNMANILGVSIPSKLRKEEYATTFADAILSCPDMWLPQLTHYELTLLQRLVKAGPDTYIEAHTTLIENTLELLSFIAVDRKKDSGKIRYMICDELREAISPHVDNYLNSKEQQTLWEVEQYACGILNLYGYAEYTMLQDLLNDYLQDSITKSEISKSLSNSALMHRFTFELVDGYNSIPCVQSPYLWDFEKLAMKLNERPDIKNIKPFSKEEVFLAGMMPLVHISNECQDELKQFMMQRLGFSEEKTEFNLQYLWFSAQLDSNGISVVTSIINGKLSSMQELQEAIELFTHYCNLCPRWFLRGYSSQEVFELFEKDKIRRNPPHLVAGPTMKAAGMDITPDIQSKFNELFRESLSGSKIGRNDPCPCGSGKKYKKCCGQDS